MPKHETLAAALAAFQAELPRLRKDETAKVKGETQDGRPVNYSYGYADLAQVVEAVSTCLGQHGLAFTAWPTMTEHGFILAYSLLHEGGEERSGTWPLPDPMRTKPQQLGSAITYARRYAQMSVTNTFPDKEDDDGAEAVPASHDEWANAKPRPPQDAPVSAPPAQPRKTVWTDEEVAAMHAKLADPTTSLDQTAKGYDWMANKGLHLRGIGASGVTGTLVLAVRLADQAMAPDASLDELMEINTLAETRGLMNVKVTETGTLSEILFDAGELAKHALAELAKATTPDPATA